MKLSWKDDQVRALKIIPHIDEQAARLIKQDVERAFKEHMDDPFVVNDTVWYQLSGTKLLPRVSNRAEHISKNFQKGLEGYGWKTDDTIADQEIDGYKEFTFSQLNTQLISEDSLRALLAQMPFDEEHIKALMLLCRCNYKRGMFMAAPLLNNANLGTCQEKTTVRVGLEFETGNIASSFRALTKLNLLFSEDHIDMAVFITSDTKQVSTRIWPSSNRNGSLEELYNRRFLSVVGLPILIGGFSPDSWSDEVGYLDKEGRYLIEPVEFKEVKLKNGKIKKMAYSNSTGWYRDLKNKERYVPNDGKTGRTPQQGDPF